MLHLLDKLSSRLGKIVSYKVRFTFIQIRWDTCRKIWVAKLFAWIVRNGEQLWLGNMAHCHSWKYHHCLGTRSPRIAANGFHVAERNDFQSIIVSVGPEDSVHAMKNSQQHYEVTTSSQRALLTSWAHGFKGSAPNSNPNISSYLYGVVGNHLTMPWFSSHSGSNQHDYKPRRGNASDVILLLNAFDSDFCYHSPLKINFAALS